MVVFGGADTRMRLAERAIVTTKRLRPVLAAMKKKGRVRKVGTVVFPATLAVDPAHLSFFNAEMRLDNALRHLNRARYSQALTELDFVVSVMPGSATARKARAMTRFLLGDFKGALEDIEVALKKDESLRAMRAVIRIYSGDAKGALEDAGDALRADPFSSDIAYQGCLVYLYAGRFKKVRRIADRLQRMTPLSPDILNVKTFLQLLEKLGPKASKKRLAFMLKVPPAIFQIYQRGVSSLQSMRLEEAITFLEQSLVLLDKYWPNHERSGGFFQERISLSLATAYAHRAGSLQYVDRKQSDVWARKSRVILEKLARKRPEWPSTSLAKCMLDMSGRVPREELLAVWKKLSRTPLGKDPLLEDLSILIGTGRSRAYFGLLLWCQFKNAHCVEALAILDEVRDLLGEGTAYKIVTRIRRMKGYPPWKVLRAYRRTYRELPEKIESDPVTLWCLAVFTLMLFALEDEVGDDESIESHSLKFLRISSIDDLTSDSAMRIAMVRFGALQSLNNVYAKRLRKDERIKSLRDEAGKGIVDFRRIRKTLSTILTDLLRPEKKLTRFVRTSLSLQLAQACFELENELRGIAEDFCRRTPSKADRKRVQASLDSWKKSKSPFFDPSWFLEGKGPFRDLINAAETMIDLRTISYFLSIFAQGSPWMMKRFPESWPKFVDFLRRDMTLLESRRLRMRK